MASRYLADAVGFRENGVTHFEVLQKGSAGDIGFWTGFQLAKVQIGDMPERYSCIDVGWLMEDTLNGSLRRA